MNWVPFLPIAAGIIVGSFTLLGVWISQRGAAAVVTRTLEGQRALAHDAALREFRKQQIAPYVEAARQRIRIWSAMYIEVGVEDKAKMLELHTQVTDAEFNRLAVTYLEIPDDAFRAAFQAFVDAEGEVKATYTRTEVMDKVKRMRIALLELNAASERFLF